MLPAPVVAALMALLIATAPALRVDPPTTPAPTGRCAQWETTALAAGWTVDQWPTVDRIMWCESNCQPGAHNRSGASGLMQLMPGWWHGRDPYDPATNLAVALAVFAAQGWRAWSCA